MSFAQIFGLVSFSPLLALGQILFKRTAESAQTLNSSHALLNLLTLPSLWLAGFLYFSATLLWIKMLQTVPLSKAYPFSALGFVLVPLAAVFFFNETISFKYILGAGLIIAGIMVTATG